MMSRSVFSGVVAGLSALVLAGTAAAQGGAIPLSQIREHTVQNLLVPGKAGEPFVVEVVVGGLPQRLTLDPYSVRSAGFAVMVEEAGGVRREVEPPPPATYQGMVEGIGGVRVAASVLDDGLHAFLDTPELGGYWMIEPLSLYEAGAPRGAHVVYPTEALPRIPGVCGMNEARPAPAAPPGSGFAGPDALLCQLALDTDHEFYQANGSSVPASIADMELVINGCDVIYRRDVGVGFGIVHVIVRSDPNDPYTSNNHQTLLGQVANHWISQQSGVARDLVHHMSGRDFDGNFLGVAFLGGLCSTSIGYATVQRPGLPNFYRIALSAHEIGHNFNAGHCDAAPDCRIMCSGLGGCTGNVSSFGASEKAQIAAFIANPRCLSYENLPLPFEELWPTPSIDAAKWPEVNGALLSTACQNPPSAPRAVLLNTTSSITSERINLPTSQVPSGVFCSYWTQRRFVEAGDTLKVEFYSSVFNRWDPLETIVSDGVDQSRFFPSEFRLPLQAFGASFRLRFSTSAADLDLWFVDDVYVGEFCLADLDRSRTLDVFDFLEFQNLYASLNPRGDWNRDGSFDIFDFLAYQNDFSEGCY